MTTLEFIFCAFVQGDATYREAVIAMEKLGCDPQEAKRIVSEWARQWKRHDRQHKQI